MRKFALPLVKMLSAAAVVVTGRAPLTGDPAADRRAALENKIRAALVEAYRLCVDANFEEAGGFTAAQLRRALASQWFVVRCLANDYARGRATFKKLYAGDVMVLAVGLSHLNSPSVNVRSIADDRLEWGVVP